MRNNKKALSPIIATILLVVVAVILVSVILSFGKSFTAQGLDKTKDIKELSRSDAELFVYPKTFSDGVMQFNYSPPNNNYGEIQITRYKILYENNETEEVVLDSPCTLNIGTNLVNLNDFSDQNVTSNKFTLILETEDNKCITLKNITNPYPYVEELSTEKLITSFDISEYTETIDDDNNTVSLSVPYGTNVTALTPTITVSDGATIDPLSGVAQDFTSPVTYTVTAEDESVRVYTVTITVEELGPLYLYNEGDGEDDWVTGYTSSCIATTKESTYLYLETNSTGSTECTFVIDTAVDLTNYTTLYIDWEWDGMREERNIDISSFDGNYYIRTHHNHLSANGGEYIRTRVFFGISTTKMDSSSTLEASGNILESMIGYSTMKVYKVWLE